MHREENVFGVSKRLLADKLYNMLDDELCDMADVCDAGEFRRCYVEVLEDYALVSKTTMIE